MFLDQEKETLLDLIKDQDYHDVSHKTYLNAKDLNELKYEYLIKKREDPRIRNVNNWNAFIVFKSDGWCLWGILIITTPKEIKKS